MRDIQWEGTGLLCGIMTVIKKRVGAGMNHYRNFITKIIQTFRKRKMHITTGGLIIGIDCGGMEEAVAQGQGGWAPPALGWGVTGTSLWGGGSYS